MSYTTLNRNYENQLDECFHDFLGKFIEKTCWLNLGEKVENNPNHDILINKTGIERSIQMEAEMWTQLRTIKKWKNLQV